MTQEEKAKRYDRAFKEAEKIHNFSSDIAEIKRMEEIFPELKESDGERVRKALVEMVHDTTDDELWVDYNVHKEDVIVWLEMQAEHANFRSKIQVGDRVTRNEDGVLVNLSQLKRVSQGEQKSYASETMNEKGEFDNGFTRMMEKEQKPTDKVEPKFEIGDLITNGILVGKIDEIHELGYHAYFGDHYADVPDAENWHKWTISDAKDGDVLISFSNHPFIYNGKFTETSVGGYCGLDVYGDFIVGEYIKDCNWTCNEDIKPATKEQRDTLFAKMKEAGYEWNAEKKELKKIEQKPAWSEEDESLRLRTIGALVTCKIGYPTKCVDEQINWLKSLRPQSTWKPSDEQMEALDDAIAICSERDYKTECMLDNLRQDLKKLREE